MGTDAASSVVGPSGESHHVDGLFVGDSSIPPNGLGGPNPTLTAQAVAARTADAVALPLLSGESHERGSQKKPRTSGNRLPSRAERCHTMLVGPKGSA